jgi:hypothetical protein
VTRRKNYTLVVIRRNNYTLKVISDVTHVVLQKQ